MVTRFIFKGGVFAGLGPATSFLTTAVQIASYIFDQEKQNGSQSDLKVLADAATIILQTPRETGLGKILKKNHQEKFVIFSLHVQNSLIKSMFPLIYSRRREDQIPRIRYHICKHSGAGSQRTVAENQDRRHKEGPHAGGLLGKADIRPQQAAISPTNRT